MYASFAFSFWNVSYIKFATNKLVNIFKHDYSELQYACQHNHLDIVKWILYSNEQDNIEEKYKDDFEKKKQEYKNSLYLICGNVVDREPFLRILVCAKQALEYGSYDVANFLLYELLEHLDYTPSSFEQFVQDLTNSVSKSKSFKCFSLVYKINEKYNVQNNNDLDEDDLEHERRILDNHIKLHHDNLLNEI